MPEKGINWLDRKDLLSLDELKLVSHLFVDMGINKIRITGGEPFVRNDIMDLLHYLSRLNGLNTISITTNGVLTAPVLPDIYTMGIRSLNLSLDTMDRNRFFAITKRDELPAVMDTLEKALALGFDIRLNAVVMEDKNIEDILPLVALTKDLPVSVRFIEEMPFNGTGHLYSGLTWDYVRIVQYIRNSYPELAKLPDPAHSTSYNYAIPGHEGNIGVIAAYSRSFCGTCNRIRITPQGMIKTCLYDEGVLNLRDMLRSGKDNQMLQNEIYAVLQQRAANGWEAEKTRQIDTPVHESMATIGG
jgi:cyclic pyranopterin phosphate synthase